MSITINTNIQSLRTQRKTNQRTSGLRTSFDRLASGKRINKASDDPAGLAIAMRLLENADTSVVATRNISDGVSLVRIAEGGLQASSDITMRMSELATQAANGTLTDKQRSVLNDEFQALSSELDRISQSTEFNGQNLLDGSSSEISIQAGTTGDTSSRIGVSLIGVSSTSLGVATDISTVENAQAAIDSTQSAVDSLADTRGAIGVQESRLNTAFETLQTSVLNEKAAASRIQDADVAAQSSELTKNSIGQQVGVAIQAQANIQPEIALKLLG